jgi:Ca-activated chloride channel family protein
MLSDFAAAYNRGGHRVAGQCVGVSVEQVNSGDAELALASGWTGSTRPNVWSPASTAWVKLLATQLQPAAAEQLLPTSPASLFQSPLVIGMPAPMATALGYPAKPIGWARILELSQDARGWTTYGHPEWGQFKLGKTNPTISTSGLHALIGAYYAAPGGANLTADSVASASAQNFVGQIEASVVHYGATATDFLKVLRYRDNLGSLEALRYVSAIAVEEQELADYNSGIVAGIQHSAPHVNLIAIYPTGGTPVADHPYVVLGWSSDVQRAAARDFEDFVRGRTQTIEARHFRVAVDPNSPTSSLKRLVSPTGNVPPLVVLDPPEGNVLAAMIHGWKSVRKSARVLILIDAAVGATALATATQALGSAVVGFLPQDKVGIWTFPAASGQAASHSVLRDVTPYTGSLRSSLENVRQVNGPSELDGALREAVTAMTASYDPNAIDAVLVLELSPGSQSVTTDLVRFLGTQTHPVRVFTIGPPSPLLEEIALAAGGTFYEPGSASHFLNDAISNF